MKTIQILLCLFTVVGCTAPPQDAEPTRDEARRLAQASGDKTDHYGNVCETWGWYNDGVCDEFCATYGDPDPDCAGGCDADSDCAPIQCLVAPCPDNVCVEGECTLDDPTDSCEAGERECAACGQTTCIPSDDMCVAIAFCPPTCGIGERLCEACGESQCIPSNHLCDPTFCPPPSRCDSGEHECQTCGEDGFTCAPDGISCPLVTCPPPSRCLSDEHECQTCGDGFTCAPAGVSCPLVTCRATECRDTCQYANDGECDDGGAGSDYSVCDLGTDCGDCGER